MDIDRVSNIKKQIQEMLYEDLSVLVEEERTLDNWLRFFGDIKEREEKHKMNYTARLDVAWISKSPNFS